MALDPKAFGERLVFARTRAGLSQAELAKRAGIGKRALETYEAGVRVPRTAAPKLAEALGVDVDWLLVGDVEFSPDLTKMAAELAGLVTQMGRALDLSERTWKAFRDRFQAVEARLGAIEMMMEQDLELDRQQSEALTAEPEDQALPPPASGRPLEPVQREPE